MMEFLLSLMVCTALVPAALGRSQHISTKTSTTMEPITTTMEPITTTQEPINNGTISCTRDYSCLDCTTVQVCAPTSDGKDLYEIKRFKCDSSYPYCHYASGTCSSYLDPTCYNSNVTVSNNFICMRDGYFPDPYNCSVYYQCKNEVAYQHLCFPPYSFYHPEYEMCVSYNYYCANTTAAQCQYNEPGTKQGFWWSNSDNLFVYCGLNDTVITVDRCIGAYVFDSYSQNCVQNCPHTGLFPKDDDCANYYKCSPQGHGIDVTFVITNMTCPEGQAFLETEYSCVDRSRVPNCQVPYPALFNK